MPNFIKNWLIKLFCSYVQYYNGKLYCFDITEEHKVKLTPSSEQESKILLVSPFFINYSEHRFPIKSRKEVKKLLSLKQTENSTFVINAYGEHDTLVGEWGFSSLLPKAWCYIPESLLLAAGLEVEQIIEVEQGQGHKNYYLGRTAAGIKMNQKTAIINSVERFLVASGALGSFVGVVSWKEKPTYLLNNALSKLFSSGVLAFSPKLRSIPYTEFCYKLFIPIILIFIMYMSISTVYLKSNNISLANQLETQQKEVSSLLDIQTQLDSQSIRYKQLAKLIQEQRNLDLLWPAMSPMFSILDIDSISLKGDRIQLRAQGESATKTLEQFLDSPYLSDAKFDSTVSNNRRGERFAISFKLKGLSDISLDTTLAIGNNAND